MNTHTAEHWIERLGLAPHPEGGFYRETWRSAETYAFAPGARWGGDRAFATSIHYLLRAGERSCLHRIASDELWFFHAGSPLTVHQLDASGAASSFTLGAAPPREVLSSVVPAGAWFGALLEDAQPEAFALVSCVVAPGFDFADFALASRDELVARFPRARALIERLT